MRAAVSKVLEGMRAGGTIGASLQADVVLYADAATRARFAASETELRFFFITSTLDFADLADKPDSAVRADLEGAEIWIDAHPSLHTKCVRCWHYRADVGTHAEHPELCGRCVDNVAGPGEPRQWF
jgi:isoleucyl-tRNA synthetase